MTVYDDYVAVSNRDKNLATIIRLMNKDLYTINERFLVNQLNMNIKKTTYMIHHRPNRKLDEKEISVRVSVSDVLRVHY